MHKSDQQHGKDAGGLSGDKEQPLLTQDGELDSEAVQEEKGAKKDASLISIVLLVNLGMIVYTALQSLTKDMLTNRNVKIYEFVFFRSLFNMCASAAIIKSQKTGDRILAFEGLAMVGAFAGIICLGLAKPEQSDEKEDSMTEFEQQYAYQIGLVLAIVSMLAQSVISVASRRLKPLFFAVIQFSYSLMATVCMGIFLVAACWGTGHVPYRYDSGWIYLEILVSAFLNMCGQNLLTYSNQYANPATVGLISYMGVLYNFLVDLFFFDTEFTSMQLIGVSVCIFFSVAAAAYKIQVQSKEQSAEEEATGQDDYKKVGTEEPPK